MLSILPKEQKVALEMQATIFHRSLPSQAEEKVINNRYLLTQILLNLPIKSLIRFKCVSKNWLSLISDPQFSLSFSQLHRRNPLPDHISGLFLARPESSIHSLPAFDFVNLHPIASNSNPSQAPIKTFSFASDEFGVAMAIGILQSCNGLFLCSTNQAQKPRHNFVYNPTTKQFAKLPPTTDEVFGLSLAFDPSKSPFYKVICVRNNNSREGRYRIDMYSPETGDWRRSGDPFFAAFDIEFDGGVFWNGSIHWISKWQHSLYFNVAEEQISPFPTPPIAENEDREHFRYFGESRGHLHLIDHIFILQTPEFDIYEMELDYSCWTVKFRVDLSNIPRAFPQILRRKTCHQPSFQDYVFTVLCVVRDKVEEESYLVMRIPGKVLRYNFKTKTFFKLCDVKPIPFRKKVVRSANLPSLVFPVVAEWRSVHQFRESFAMV